jgi:hypothetical protein
MPARRKLAEIVQEASFSAELDQYSGNHQRMSDVHASIDWRLARDPLKATKLDGECYIFKTTPVGETPSFWVLYKYDASEHRVYLLSIVEVPA